MYINEDVVNGRVKRVCGRARERRGLRSHNYRETALGQLEHTAGVLQERRGRIAVQLERARSRLDLTSSPTTENC